MIDTDTFLNFGLSSYLWHGQSETFQFWYTDWFEVSTSVCMIDYLSLQCVQDHVNCLNNGSSDGLLRVFQKGTFCKRPACSS